MQTIFAPDFLQGPRPWVFLAGSIEQGAAKPWQAALTKILEFREGTLLNPRRPVWDPNVRQSITDPAFRGQVEWELVGQKEADLILMVFDPATKSPVTLLELGLFADSGKLVVCCPEGYWRKGNVEIVCERYQIPLETDFEKLVGKLDKAIVK